MGSIPLPALSVRPVAQPDVLANMTRLAQLRGLQQEEQQRSAMAPFQQQIAQQQAQSGQLQLQQQQIALKDQQAMTAAMQQWDGNKIDDLPALVIKNGGSANAVMGLKNQIIGQKQKISQMAAEDAATGASNVKTMAERNSILSGKLSALEQVPDDQLGQAITQGAQELVQQGLLDPQHAQMAAQMAQLPPDQARQHLETMRKGLLSTDQLLAQAGQQEKTRHDQALEAQAAATQANTQAYRQAELGVRNRTADLEAQRLDLQQKQLGYGQNGQPSTLAQAIASGHIVPERLSYLLSRNPGLIEGVTQIDPSFDSSKAQSYPQTYKDFTSGKTSIALNAGGTALQHLEELSKMNTVESHIPGTPDYNAYMNKADTVSSELAKFYGDATIPAIAAIKKTLTATLPGNRQAAIETQAKSMGDKLDNFEQTWRNAAPSKAYQAPMPGISDQAKAARAALDPSYRARTQQGMQGLPNFEQNPSAAPGGPQEGSTKTNSSGDKIIFKGGQWQLAQ